MNDTQHRRPEDAEDLIATLRARIAELEARTDTTAPTRDEVDGLRDWAWTPLVNYWRDLAKRASEAHTGDAAGQAAGVAPLDRSEWVGLLLAAEEIKRRVHRPDLVAAASRAGVPYGTILAALGLVDLEHVRTRLEDAVAAGESGRS